MPQPGADTRQEPSCWQAPAGQTSASEQAAHWPLLQIGVVPPQSAEVRQATHVPEVVLQYGVAGVVVHSALSAHPHVPVSVWQIGVIPAQGVSFTQPVRVSLQSCGIPVLEHCRCPMAQVGATHWPSQQMGVSVVSAHWADSEQPHLPVEG